MIHHLTRNKDYLFRVEDQEHTLRFLIARNPTIIEFRYFLMLLLIASKQYQKVQKEYQRILNIYPNNSIAQSLDKIFWSKEFADCSHSRSNRRKKRKGHNPWLCSGLRKNKCH